MKNTAWKKSARRAVIVSGARTPFVKAFGDFTKLDTIALGAIAVRGLLEEERLRAQGRRVDRLGRSHPPERRAQRRRARSRSTCGSIPACEGMTVSRACASGLQAMTLAAAAIERGEADVDDRRRKRLDEQRRDQAPAEGRPRARPLALGKPQPSDYLGVLSQLAPFSDVLPKMPKIAERTTGEVMGESAERMARRNEISREAQDEFAVRSHQRAAAAIACGRFDDEVVPVQTPDGKWVHADGLVRADTSVEKLAKLRPVFAPGKEAAPSPPATRARSPTARRRVSS